MTISQLVLCGDSLAQGTEGNSETAKGGKGSWAELVAEGLANIAGIGPLLSPGLRGCWLGIVAGDKSGEWIKTGTWTQTVSTDAFDKAPCGFAYYASAGTGDVMTFTKPVAWRAIVGFSVEWIDYTSGGSWQYRVDGGTWTNHGQTIANANAYKRFYISTAVGSTVDFRAYNGSGNAGICLVGIVPYFTNPVGVTQGLIFHDLGVNGQTLHGQVLATSGDRMAFFDAVTLGTGSPISNAPNVGTVNLNINDVTSPGVVATWGTDLTTFYNRVSPLGPVGFLCPWECGAGTTGVAQDSFRNDATNGTHAKATALGAKVRDLFDDCKALGFGSALGAQQPILSANGFMIAGDGTHPAQAGHTLLASWIYWFIRNQILSIGNVPSSYPVSAKQAAVQYSGNAAAVQYSAGAPVSVG